MRQLNTSRNIIKKFKFIPVVAVILTFLTLFSLLWELAENARFDNGIFGTLLVLAILSIMFSNIAKLMAHALVFMMLVIYPIFAILSLIFLPFIIVSRVINSLINRYLKVRENITKAIKNEDSENGMASICKLVSKKESILSYFILILSIICIPIDLIANMYIKDYPLFVLSVSIGIIGCFALVRNKLTIFRQKKGFYADNTVEIREVLEFIEQNYEDVDFSSGGGGYRELIKPEDLEETVDITKLIPVSSNQAKINC